MRRSSLCKRRQIPGVLWSPYAEQSNYVFVECVRAAANETLVPLILDDQAPPSEREHLLGIKLTDFEAQKAEILSRLQILHLGSIVNRPLPPPPRRYSWRKAIP